MFFSAHEFILFQLLLCLKYKQFNSTVDRCLKAVTSTGRKHLFLFKLQIKVFSFSFYVTTETTPKGQIPSRDISVDHGSNAILVLLQLPFQHIQKAKLEITWDINKHFESRKIFQHWPQQKVQFQEKTQSSSILRF